MVASAESNIIVDGSIFCTTTPPGLSLDLTTLKNSVVSRWKGTNGPR
jgi:hypothetical protein